MMRKGILTSVTKKVFALSGNQCCFPGCTERLFNQDEGVLLGEMCHIRAVSATGPRYDSNYPKDAVDSFENLMIMCPNHHTIIDENFEKYTVEVLLRIKNEHESRIHEISKSNIVIIDGQKGEISVESLKNLEVIFDSKFSSDVAIELPEKVVYPAPSNYIHRYVSPARGDIKDFGNEFKSISSLILEENRLTILGVGGSGKSIELDQLAYIHSNYKSNFFPVKIRLNILTSQDIDELLRLEFSEIDKVPQSRLLILLDALDEVHADYIDVASTKIEILSKKYSDSKMVVTCRNNFYITETSKRKAKLEGFKSYLIQPLDYTSIYFYLKDRVNIDPEEFIFNLKKRKFYDLLYSPFFLVHIVEIFETKQEYPSSKKSVFEYLILQRIEKDYEKFANAGVNIQDYSFRISRIIQELAIVTECLGRNFLDDRIEVQRLVTNHEFLEIIKRTFLFNKSNFEGRWEFEHNNFQEFLAAQFLSELSFEEIQKFVAFSPDFNKVKPSWLNTVSFVFSLLDTNDGRHKELVDWIIKVEPDVLVRFEKDKLKLEQREKLFRVIYEDFESKQIIVRNEKFESEDLAIFVSDSKEIIKYLILKIKNSNDRLVITEAARILHYFELIQVYSDEVREALRRVIIREDFSEEIKYECLNALARLGISNQALTNEILECIDLESSQYIRSGFYRYLDSSSHAENFINIILRGFEILEGIGVTINGKPKKEKPFLSEEKYILKRLFDKVNTSENVIRIIKWVCELESPSSLHSEFFKVIHDLLEKAAEEYKNCNEIFDQVLILLKSFSRRYHRELGESFRKFFRDTDTVDKAFKSLYTKWMINKDGGFDLTYGMAIICDEACLKFVVSEIKAGIFVEPKTWQLRNVLGMNGNKEMNDFYQNELLKIDSAKYALRKNDYELKGEDRQKRDLELLFSKEEFLYEVNEIFKEEENPNKRELTSDELYDWKMTKFNDDEMTNTIVVETLRSFARDKGIVEFSEIEELVKSSLRWSWFQIHNLIRIDQNIEGYEFTTEATNFILNWVKRELETANFHTAIKHKNENSYSYRFAELYISYFIQRLDIEVTSPVYLDLLSLECFLLPNKNKKVVIEGEGRVPDTFDFVVKKVGFEKVVERVIYNLVDGNKVPIVRQSHIKFCHDFKVKEVAPMILDEILNAEWDVYYQREFISMYVKLSSDLGSLLENFEFLPQESQIHTARLIAEAGFFEIFETIKNQIQSIEDEGVKFEYIQILKIQDEKIAFDFEKKWILRNKQLPERQSDSNFFMLIPKEELIEILEDAFKFKYGEGMWSSRNDYLSALIEIGAQNEESYLRIREKIKQWLKDYEGVKFLHYQLQNLEQKYYSKISQTMTFDKAVQVVRHSQSSRLY
ncbi:NACHT domain-containing protein [Peijinzhouia sedimentorum]